VINEINDYHEIKVISEIKVIKGMLEMDETGEI